MKELQQMITHWKQVTASLEKSETTHRKNRCYYLAEGCYQMAKQLRNCIAEAELLLKKRSSKRRRVSPKGGQSNVRKADVARRAKRRKE